MLFWGPVFLIFYDVIPLASAGMLILLSVFSGLCATGILRYRLANESKTPYSILSAYSLIPLSLLVTPLVLFIVGFTPINIFEQFAPMAEIFMVTGCGLVLLCYSVFKKWQFDYENLKAADEKDQEKNSLSYKSSYGLLIFLKLILAATFLFSSYICTITIFQNGPINILNFVQYLIAEIFHQNILLGSQWLSLLSIFTLLGSLWGILTLFQSLKPHPLHDDIDKELRFQWIRYALLIGILGCVIAVCVQFQALELVPGLCLVMGIFPLLCGNAYFPDFSASKIGNIRFLQYIKRFFNENKEIKIVALLIILFIVFSLPLIILKGIGDLTFFNMIFIAIGFISLMFYRRHSFEKLEKIHDEVDDFSKKVKKNLYDFFKKFIKEESVDEQQFINGIDAEELYIFFRVNRVQESIYTFYEFLKCFSNERDYSIRILKTLEIMHEKISSLGKKGIKLLESLQRDDIGRTHLHVLAGINCLGVPEVIKEVISVFSDSKNSNEYVNVADANGDTALNCVVTMMMKETKKSAEELECVKEQGCGYLKNVEVLLLNGAKLPDWRKEQENEIKVEKASLYSNLLAVNDARGAALMFLLGNEWDYQPAKELIAEVDQILQETIHSYDSIDEGFFKNVLYVQMLFKNAVEDLEKKPETEPTPDPNKTEQEREKEKDAYDKAEQTRIDNIANSCCRYLNELDKIFNKAENKIFKKIFLDQLLNENILFLKSFKQSIQKCELGSPTSFTLQEPILKAASVLTTPLYADVALLIFKRFLTDTNSAYNKKKEELKPHEVKLNQGVFYKRRSSQIPTAIPTDEKPTDDVRRILSRSAICIFLKYEQAQWQNMGSLLTSNQIFEMQHIIDQKKFQWENELINIDDFKDELKKCIIDNNDMFPAGYTSVEPQLDEVCRLIVILHNIKQEIKSLAVQRNLNIDVAEQLIISKLLQSENNAPEKIPQEVRLKIRKLVGVYHTFLSSVDTKLLEGTPILSSRHASQLSPTPLSRNTSQVSPTLRSRRTSHSSPTLPSRHKRENSFTIGGSVASSSILWEENARRLALEETKEAPVSVKVSEIDESEAENSGINSSNVETKTEGLEI